MALPWSIPSDGIGWLPQLLLICFYGYILLKASQTISAGSEMLLLLYGPGIIGGLVIPLLGAVPDAAMILVSGVGPRDEVQEQLSVGVGTLAGSTIMLLTLPWAAGVFLARRDLDPATGEAASITTASGAQKPKLTHFSLTTNVVTTFDSIPKMSKIMMLTALSYLIIQIPAFADKHDPDAAGEERPFALAGFIVTIIALFAYSGYQLYDARNDQIVEEKKREVERKRWQNDLSNKLQRMGSDIHKVFHQFDHDHSGHLDREELAQALQTLGLEVDRQELNKMVSEMDTNKDGRVSEDEFVTVFTRWVENSTSTKLRHGGSSQNLLSPKGHNDQKTPVAHIPESGSINAGVNEPLLGEVNGAVQLAVAASSADDDEEEEEEDDFTALTDSELFRKAMFLLMGGTAMVTIFSDPMVDVIENFGNTIGVSPFYIAFCVNPISSNASEVISALIFAKKKTNRGISLTFASLYGAACMNNTLGLAIFMALVYFRNLTWTFSAEVISILIVIGVVGVNGLFKTVRLWQAIVVAAMFPLSLILVASMEKAGLDN